MTCEEQFKEYIKSLPDTHWSKYDLSAVRQGWDASRQHYETKVREAIDSQAKYLVDGMTGGLFMLDPASDSGVYIKIEDALKATAEVFK